MFTILMGWRLRKQRNTRVFQKQDKAILGGGVD
jgi:hypothetical protein